MEEAKIPVGASAPYRDIKWNRSHQVTATNDFEIEFRKTNLIFDVFPDELIFREFGSIQLAPAGLYSDACIDTRTSKCSVKTKLGENSCNEIR